ncbi:hypothetical protein GCM10023084_54060 [Streptomyces lacrimifluminis]|uniref:Uncharacterized protein n=1 Tax=Streptomyces lacrimifluminis TaxID=1500077 RepID=A0A917NXA9_9ACTN|nr:hypothetical protein [Streptomyces lacrimifluminis]GGJ34308.1 hypothetical protein GCM10012282_33800 [Streptomyces lacrimifluminis]
MSNGDPYDDTRELLPLGFMPGKAISENDPRMAKLENFQQSLFQSTTASPKIVVVRVSSNDTLPLIIDTARAIWVVNDGIDTPKPVYHDTPEWYFEGQVHRSSLRVRMHVVATDGSYIDRIALQFITDEHVEDGIIWVECIDQD